MWKLMVIHFWWCSKYPRALSTSLVNKHQARTGSRFRNLPTALTQRELELQQCDWLSPRAGAQGRHFPVQLAQSQCRPHYSRGRVRRCSPDLARPLAGRAPQRLLCRCQPCLRQRDLFHGTTHLPSRGGRRRRPRGSGDLHLRLTPHGGVKGELYLLLCQLAQLGGGGSILARVPLRQRSGGPVFQDLGLQRI